MECDAIIQTLRLNETVLRGKGVTPQSLEDLQAFEASVQQALAEMNALLLSAR